MNSCTCIDCQTGKLEISSHSDGSYEIYPLPKITGTIFKYVGLVLVIFNEIVELQILSGCFLKDSNHFNHIKNEHC